MAAELAKGSAAGQPAGLVGSNRPEVHGAMLLQQRRAEEMAESRSSLYRKVMERVRSFSQIQHPAAAAVQTDQMRRSSSHGLFGGSPPSSPRSPRSPYTTLEKRAAVPSTFQMPVHYPRYSKADYEAMPEEKLDRLLEEYGLPVLGSLPDKRKYAMGVFLWKDQCQ